MSGVLLRKRKPSQAKCGRSSGQILALCLFLLVFALCSCSGYKFVRKQELEILAEGIEWFVERAKPQESLEGEEKAKFERVGPKLSRNARALAE